MSVIDRMMCHMKGMARFFILTYFYVFNVLAH